MFNTLLLIASSEIGFGLCEMLICLLVVVYLLEMLLLTELSLTGVSWLKVMCSFSKRGARCSILSFYIEVSVITYCLQYSLESISH